MNRARVRTKARYGDKLDVRHARACRSYVNTALLRRYRDTALRTGTALSRQRTRRTIDARHTVRMTRHCAPSRAYLQNGTARTFRLPRHCSLYAHCVRFARALPALAHRP